jgi:tripartite-type tricarboxylate transporter receptor subunit TctC
MEKKLNSVSLVIKGTFLFIMVALVIGGFNVTFAQEYPTQPITIVVGSAAGGVTDVATRTLGEQAKKSLGVEILVTTKTGAMHTVAMSYVISRPPDGYTLGSSTDAPFSRAPYIMTLNFNPLKDVIPIIAYGTFPDLIVARGDSPFKTFKDAIDFAKENPGKLTYGHLGTTSISYLNMAALALQMGIKVSPVPFNGDAEVILSLLGGHIMTGGIGIGSSVSQLKAGKLKILAMVQGEERWEKFPDVPTLYELGFKDATPPPNLMIWGPKGLPDPTVKKLEDAFKKASESAEFKKFTLDNEIYSMKRGQQAITGQELQNFLAKTYAIYGNLFQKLGVGKQPTKP